MANKKKQLICNSTAEFLIFTGHAGEKSIEARYEDETIWLSQKLMAALFDVGVNTINYHLKEVYDSGEIQREATIRKFRIVQAYFVFRGRAGLNAQLTRLLYENRADFRA